MEAATRGAREAGVRPVELNKGVLQSARPPAPAGARSAGGPSEYEKT
jgi:hypothetical protein